MEAHGPILALIGARSGREPLTAPLASSGGQAMRWGTARDDADQVEQDPLKCRRPGCVPPIARLANVSKVMGFHDGPAACRLSVQRRHKLFERLAGSHVPAAIPVLAPRVGDRAAFEAPLQPAQLVMGNMLEQLDRRPAGRQPAAAQLAAGHGFQLAHQPGAKVVEVTEEDLRARGHRNGGLREWQAHEQSMPHHSDRRARRAGRQRPTVPPAGQTGPVLPRYSTRPVRPR